MAITKQTDVQYINDYPVAVDFWRSNLTNKIYYSEAEANAAEEQYKAKEPIINNLADQIGKINNAVENKNWTGTWAGGGQNAIRSAAEKLYNKGVTNLLDLTVKKTEEQRQEPDGGNVYTVQVNQLVDKNTGKVISSSEGNTFVIDAYDTGNIFKSTDKTFGITFSPDGYAVPYQTNEKGGLLRSPILPLALMFIPGMQGLGASIGTALGASGAAATALGNAVIGGTLAEAQGGDFLKGAVSGAAGSLVPGVQSEIATGLGGGTAANIAAGALTGGIMAELTGGDFSQGALTGGIGAGINQAKLSAAEDYLRSLPSGYGDFPAPTEQDVLDYIAAESPNFQISNTTFRPDYSLATGASGEPGITLKPLDTQYKVGSFDYTLGELIDSLGLKMPTTPNIEGMGGGQGIVIRTQGGYVTEQGFIPDSYVASLGDPESFINKPVIDVDLSLEELKEATPEDISKKLSLLDIAKALTPAALAALTKKVVDTAKSEATSGFQIVPIPSTWKSPEYDMAFAPSAPIDFGTPTLLRGTQWETPISLSGLINTLNQPMIAPQTQQMMTQFQAPEVPYETGITDIIGEIGGQPVSIADIISGIQSGQNYSS